MVSLFFGGWQMPDCIISPLNPFSAAVISRFICITNRMARWVGEKGGLKSQLESQLDSSKVTGDYFSDVVVYAVVFHGYVDEVVGD